MKYLKYIIPIVIVAAIFGYLRFNKSSSVEGIKLVPTNAMYIFQTTKPIKNWKSFSSHSIWQLLKTHPAFIDIEDDANYLDTLISSNDAVFSFLDDRSLTISAHETNSKSYDFLFFVELEASANSSIVNTTLSNILKSNNYTVSTYDHDDLAILKAVDDNGETLVFTQIGTQLVISFNEKLVQSVVESVDANSLVDDNEFSQLYKSIPNDGLGQLFINYHFLDDLFACYMSDGLESVREITSLFSYTGFDCLIDDQSWILEGLTLTDTTKTSVVSAVLNSGASQNRAGDVLSNRTAWFMSFNFSDFETFRKNLESLRSVDASLKSYEKNIQRIESLLNINVDEDLLSWIGDEVTVAQLKKNLSYDTDEAAVLLIKARDVGLATKHLNHISQQVKKRTPAKFRSIVYHNYNIQYLDIKGFFRAFFGKAFDKIDKPYFAIIGDYVVFCNSPYTIVGLIEDYENDRNLSNSASYQRFVKDNDQTSVTLYASPSNLYPALLPLMEPESKKTLSESERYFRAFESFGITLSGDNSAFKTRIQLTETVAVKEEEFTSQESIRELYSQFAEERDINSKNFAMEWIEDGLYIKKYPGSEITQIEGKTSDGVLDGNYTEYYKNGEKKVDGKYKMGRKKGTWKYYDEKGKLTEKKKY